MYNPILWTLDNEISGDIFERLCTDLLSRVGYKDIIPIGGTQDAGRDAEIRNWKGIKSPGAVTFFQYSLEKNWRYKFEKELDKVKSKGHAINFYVFVTSQKVTGKSRDSLSIYTRENYGWELIIYDREWLRHHLEESSPDLALKYLGVTNSNIHGGRESKLETIEPLVNESEKAWEYYLQENYERAAVEFKDLVNKDPKNKRAWQALASCQYALLRYNEAIESIGNAINIDENDLDSMNLKASILTEYGIEKGDKASLLLSRDIFKKVVEKYDQWISHYNYANVLSALGDNENAMIEYLKAIENNLQQPEIWKNLGTVYHQLKEHEKEIECYDKALALNNQLSEALLSKGITLLTVFNQSKEAIQLIENGIKAEEAISLKWPHCWYWLAEAYFRENNIEEALERVNIGLLKSPSHYGLLNLKAIILSKLWEKNRKYIDEAISFYKYRIELFDEDHDSLTEIMRIFNNTGQKKTLSAALKLYLGITSINPLDCLQYSKHDKEEFINALRYYSTYKSFRESETISEYLSILKEQNILFDDDFETILFIVFSIPFGKACDIFLSSSELKQPDIVNDIQNLLYDSLGYSFPLLGVCLMDTVDTSKSEKIADGLSRVMFHWADIALLEFSRQLGYIGGYFGISSDELDNFITNPEDRIGKWSTNIMTTTLFEINKKLKIIKE